MEKSIGQISAKVIGTPTPKTPERKKEQEALQYGRYRNRMAGEKLKQASLLLDDAAKLTNDSRVANHCSRLRDRSKFCQKSLAKPCYLEGGYVMLSVVQMQLITKTLRKLPTQLRPKTALEVFVDAVMLIKTDSGLIETNRREIAERLGLPPGRVSASLKLLCRLQIFEREQINPGKKRYRYFLNPHVGWRGELELGVEAAEKIPPPAPPTSRVLELIKDKS